MLFTDVQLRAKCHATLIKFSTIEKFTSEGQEIKQIRESLTPCLKRLLIKILYVNIPVLYFQLSDSIKFPKM